MLLAEGCTKKNEDRSAVAREIGTLDFFWFEETFVTFIWNRSLQGAAVII